MSAEIYEIYFNLKTVLYRLSLFLERGETASKTGEVSESPQKYMKYISISKPFFTDYLYSPNAAKPRPKPERCPSMA